MIKNIMYIYTKLITYLLLTIIIYVNAKIDRDSIFQLILAYH